jgi:hypothetical protein
MKKWRRTKRRADATSCRLQVRANLLGKSRVAVGSVLNDKSRKSEMSLDPGRRNTGADA